MLNDSQLPALASNAIEDLEKTLLLKCARASLEASTISQIQYLCRQQPNWERLAQLAEEHGVRSLLFKSLKEACPDLVPPKILENLHHFFRRNALNTLPLTSELLRLLKLFNTHGSKAIPFKGPILASTAYGSTALRHIGDLDILVTESDYRQIQSLLFNEGYELISEIPWESHFASKDGRLHIDLHPRVIPKHLDCGLSEEYWWSHLTFSLLNGTKVEHFSPEAQLVMLCQNGAKECWNKLRRICDVAELLKSSPHLNWDEVIDQAYNYGYKRMIFLGLHLAHSNLDAPLPKALKQEVDSDKVVQVLALEVSQRLLGYQSGPLVEIERTFFCIRVRDRYYHRIQGLIEFLKFYSQNRPSKDTTNLFTVPESLSFLYSLIIPFRIIKYVIPNLPWVLMPSYSDRQLELSKVEP